jgi:hypothetical protein
MITARLRFLGTWTLAACCALLCSLGVLTAPAWGAYESVPTPTIEGPIPVTPSSQIFMHTTVNLAAYGYVEEEYFISGTGYTYTTTGAVNVTGTKVTTGGPNSNGTYPFKTRIVVRRPENAGKFNGKVLVEWQNVTAGFDLEPQWDGNPYNLMKEGYAYVAVDAQTVGVKGLKTYDPERYNSLEVGPSNDSLSYAIYGSALKAIRGDGVGPEPLGELTPDITNVTATGASQSCSKLVIDYNKVIPLQEGIANDFLLTDCTEAIRADQPAAKVLRVISEYENKNEQTEAEYPTNPALRHWEAAAGSHVPWMVQADWGPEIEREVGPAYSDCTKTPILSTVEWPYAVNAGTKELIEWDEGGPPPPAVPRGEYVNSKTLKRNSLGIALGGLRMPEAEVPDVVDLAENSAHANPNPYPFSAFCVLLGQHQPLSEETRNSLYPNISVYIEKVKADAEKLEEKGLLLPEGAARIVDAAEEVPNLRPTTPALSTPSPNKGTFKLTWRGPVPSYPQSLVPGFVETHPTFEVQHLSSAPGAEWTTVASGLSEPSYSFSPEEEGTWSYRVRSNTVVPSFDLEPEHTITSPWSEVLSGVVVDRTPPNTPAAEASREPDYAGGGGWYTGSVEVVFSSTGDPNLPDTSPGSGVNPETLTKPVSFNTSGSHTACGTDEDYAGNLSAEGCKTVQVDNTPPSLEVSCPAMVPIGSSANAEVSASDAYSGLKTNPSGTYPINTSKSGDQTTTETAISNVGLETTKSCTTHVGYYVVVTGTVDRLVVRAGEAVELTSTAKVNGPVTVKPEGALDIEGATLKDGLASTKAELLRVCGASIGGTVTVSKSTGSVVFGEGTAECAGNTVAGGGGFKNNTASVLIDGNSFGKNLVASGNTSTTTVTNNKVTGNLTVKGNTGTTIDHPNEVKGKSKLQ